MPALSHDTTTDRFDTDGYSGRFGELDRYTVAFETYTADADLAPYMRGLPDDRCQCPHWGYVLKGRLTYHYADHSETIVQGQAYYAPPGHTPELHEGTEVVEFSPTDELRKTIDVVTQNMAGAT